MKKELNERLFELCKEKETQPVDIQNVIDQGAEIDSFHGQKESTALMAAVLFNNIHLIDVLLDNGADINYENKNNITPIFFSESVAVLNKLIDRGADINKSFYSDLFLNEKISLFEYFISNNQNVSMIDSLINNGAKNYSETNLLINIIVNENNITDLKNTKDIIYLLKEKYCDIYEKIAVDPDEKDHKEETEYFSLIDQAVSVENFEVAKILLELDENNKYAQIEREKKNIKTKIITRMQYTQNKKEFDKFFPLLVKHGFDFEPGYYQAIIGNNATATRNLVDYSIIENIDILKYIKENYWEDYKEKDVMNGSYFNHIVNQHPAALISNFWLEKTEEFLSYNLFDLNMKDEKNRNAFHSLVTMPMPDPETSIQKLLEIGYNINQKDIDGNTPIMNLIKVKDFNNFADVNKMTIFNAFLDNGADPLIKNKKGEGIEDIAFQYNRTDVIEKWISKKTKEEIEDDITKNYRRRKKFL